MAKKMLIVFLSILEKMGKEVSKKISETRAKAKLVRAIEKEGLPDDIELTDKELKCLDDLGYDVDFDDEEEEEPEEDEDEDEEEDDDEDDEEEEEEKPSKKKKSSKKSDKKKKGKKKPEPKKVKGKKRIECICDALKKLSKKGKTAEDIAEVANKDFVKEGGNDNVKQTAHTIRVILPTLINFELVSVKKGKIFPC